MLQRQPSYLLSIIAMFFVYKWVRISISEKARSVLSHGSIFVKLLLLWYVRVGHDWSDLAAAAAVIVTTWKATGDGEKKKKTNKQTKKNSEMQVRNIHKMSLANAFTPSFTASDEVLMELRK